MLSGPRRGAPSFGSSSGPLKPPVVPRAAASEPGGHPPGRVGQGLAIGAGVALGFGCGLHSLGKSLGDGLKGFGSAGSSKSVEAAGKYLGDGLQALGSDIARPEPPAKARILRLSFNDSLVLSAAIIGLCMIRSSPGGGNAPRSRSRSRSRGRSPGPGPGPGPAPAPAPAPAGPHL
ncbi:hypothetical protein HYH03_018916 [Edaphochlamys debaryana]|uniref:Uncharacterized protein n=1 Tax=Edaphochlamys debaryana TaxID=47281 RepID=A0A835XF25_9CHLO|nr:hypothetical protein HYH03_018916 [Edaphochlamys debaryana]|eukprot:KAG2482130.1 hypothetical protein HYH03_018916 [Edaphochlamys debaryana]